MDLGRSGSETLQKALDGPLRLTPEPHTRAMEPNPELLRLKLEQCRPYWIRIPLQIY
jgi:hypothetical protein